MFEVVLLQKVYSDDSLVWIEEWLRENLKGLDVKVTSLRATENSWLQVGLEGDDVRAASRLLEREIGAAPNSAETLRNVSTLRGRVTEVVGSTTGIHVDLGVSSPEPIYGTVALERLQGQLVDGRRFSLQRIIEMFCLVEGFPVEVRLDENPKVELEAELAEEQLNLYENWIRSRVDRLIILGASNSQAKNALEKLRLKRYVAGVQSLGILEQSLICKLGTHAAGLIPKLGRRLPDALLSTFSPSFVLEFVGDRWG